LDIPIGIVIGAGTSDASDVREQKGWKFGACPEFREPFDAAVGKSNAKSQGKSSTPTTISQEMPDNGKGRQ